MSEGVDAVVVRVSDRILWVGDDAYPVPNISRIGSGRWQPDGLAIWWKCAVSSAIVLVVAFFLGEVTRLDPTSVGPGVVWGIALPLVMALIMRAGTAANKPDAFLLTVESGSSRSTIASYDRDVIQKLATNLVDVINKPHAEFQEVVDNVLRTRKM